MCFTSEVVSFVEFQTARLSSDVAETLAQSLENLEPGLRSDGHRQQTMGDVNNGWIITIDNDYG